MRSSRTSKPKKGPPLAGDREAVYWLTVASLDGGKRGPWYLEHTTQQSAVAHAKWLASGGFSVAAYRCLPSGETEKVAAYEPVGEDEG